MSEKPYKDAHENESIVSEPMAEYSSIGNQHSIYTMAELNARIDEAEIDFNAGRGIPTEIAHQQMKQFIAGL